MSLPTNPNREITAECRYSFLLLSDLDILTPRIVSFVPHHCCRPVARVDIVYATGVSGSLFAETSQNIIWGHWIDSIQAEKDRHRKLYSVSQLLTPVKLEIYNIESQLYASIRLADSSTRKLYLLYSRAIPVVDCVNASSRTTFTYYHCWGHSSSVLKVVGYRSGRLPVLRRYAAPIIW